MLKIFQRSGLSVYFFFILQHNGIHKFKTVSVNEAENIYTYKHIQIT
jgi:hypothetical protein